MGAVSVISTRLITCPSCGHPERLVTETDAEIRSHCYVCEDFSSRPRAWSPGVALVGRRRVMALPENGAAAARVRHAV